MPIKPSITSSLVFTAKLAGTERGITEPTRTFSACFGAEGFRCGTQLSTQKCW
ncbi:phosphoenolpyruvate carboxykinase (ATP) [Escherichia coli]